MYPLYTTVVVVVLLTAHFLWDRLPAAEYVRTSPLIRLQFVVVERRILAYQIDQRDNIIGGRIVLVITFTLRHCNCVCMCVWVGVCLCACVCVCCWWFWFVACWSSSPNECASSAANCYCLLALRLPDVQRVKTIQCNALVLALYNALNYYYYC